jgi:hypothetical protein
VFNVHGRFGTNLCWPISAGQSHNCWKHIVEEQLVKEQLVEGQQHPMISPLLIVGSDSGGLAIA